MDKAEESILKTTGDLESARSHLLGALAHADPVEALVVQDLLEQLMPVLNKTQQLFLAMETKE